MSPDKNPAHFVLYYSGFYTGCVSSSTTQNCPSSVWHRFPDSSLDHDINEIAFDPGSTNCAIYEVSDFGVLKMAPPTSDLPCGDPRAWTLPGSAGVGFGALQIYQIAGHVQYPIAGVFSGHTNLFIGTMDNLLWGTYDTGAPRWQCLGPPSCEPEGTFLQVAAPSQLLTQVTFDSLDTGAIKSVQLNQVFGTLSNETDWTNITPPGNGSPPFVVSVNTYVEWSGGTLYLTQDNGQSWVPVGTLPSNIRPFDAIQVANTANGPAIYDMVSDSSGNQGIALLVHFLPPPSSPAAFEIQTIGGTNSRGTPSGLKAVWGNCFGQGSFYCAPVFAADPNDYRHLYASDSIQKFVAVSADTGESWKEDIALTNLVTTAGVSMTDSIGNSQVHVFAFDPANSSHILVGTDQAGIFASENGGLTWSALPNTAKATAITSFFFDDRTNAVFVGTYGRGLWKLVLDWTTVLPVMTLTLQPPAGTNDDAPKRKITVLAKDSRTGALVSGAVSIGGKSGLTGQEISYPGCAFVDPQTHVRQYVPCKGSVIAPPYAAAIFTD
jgi:hypothetical protein